MTEEERRKLQSEADKRKARRKANRRRNKIKAAGAIPDGAEGWER